MTSADRALAEAMRRDLRVRPLRLIKAKLPDPNIIETSVVPNGAQLKAARANIRRNGTP